MDKFQDIIQKLKNKNVMFDVKMSTEEIKKIELLYDISFPLELKQFYSYGLPVSDGFYNWRDMSEENILNIKKILQIPILGLQFDLENGDFWCEEWGEKPISSKEAQDVLLKHYSSAPKLVPIYSHRYMPFIGENTNVPIFSIHQSDIIYYGENLISYLEIEFGFKKHKELMKANFEFINFWSEIL